MHFVATYKWLKFLLANEIKFCDKVVEVFVARVHMRFLYVHRHSTFLSNHFQKLTNVNSFVQYQIN